MSLPVPRPRPRLRRRWLWLLAIGVLLAAGFCGLRFLHLPERMTQLLEWVRTLGPRAPLFFVGLYVLASVLSVPCFPLTVGAGALFGPFWGTVWVSLGSSLGSSASFLISRFIARAWVNLRVP